MDGRVPGPRNTLPYEGDASARLRKEGSPGHCKLVVDRKSRHFLCWYTMVVRRCDRSRRLGQQCRLEDTGEQGCHGKGRE